MSRRLRSSPRHSWRCRARRHPASPPRCRGRHRARRRNFSGERVVRSLLRHVSACGEPAGRDSVHAIPTRRRWPACGDCSPRNPNFTNPANGVGCGESLSAAPSQAATADQDHSYTQEQLATTTARWISFRRRSDRRHAARQPRAAGAEVAESGLLRRQHRHRALELRAAIRDERSLFQTTFGPSVPGR